MRRVRSMPIHDARNATLTTTGQNEEKSRRSSRCQRCEAAGDRQAKTQKHGGVTRLLNQRLGVNFARPTVRLLAESGASQRPTSFIIASG